MAQDWFLYADPIHSTTIKAAISNGALSNVPSCPLVVGDTLSFPGSRLAYRVVSRHLQPNKDGSAMAWALKIEPVPNPMTD
ncbi:hypothetical protein [Variovorax sp. 278MFTsu5.1]|uniref:hypothetical protein n=1 Tax=Variovorax sp. 278MFTsu5.1 TaxID=3158366 RepID=UPI003AAD80DA